ncbi:MAG: hypothetical protein AAFO82_04535, partial [Bacteroidota bacterium]
MLASCLSVSWSNSLAQSNPFSNQRSQIIPFQVADYELDSLTILPEFLQLSLAKEDSTQSSLQLDSTFFSIQNTRLSILKIDSQLQAKHPLVK